jgi:hypothetical protein
MGSQILPIDSLTMTMASSSFAPEISLKRPHNKARKRAMDMIDGLHLTIPGEELRRLLEQRIENHRQRADWWKRERARTPEEQTEDEPVLPEHICENEAERHEWRAAVLGFIRDRIESAEVYRLGEADLYFAELLPEKPGWLEQQEYEERTSMGFHLERLSNRVGEVMSRELAFPARQAGCDE